MLPIVVIVDVVVVVCVVVVLCVALSLVLCSVLLLGVVALLVACCCAGVCSVSWYMLLYGTCCALLLLSWLVIVGCNNMAGDCLSCIVSCCLYLIANYWWLSIACRVVLFLCLFFFLWLFNVCALPVVHAPLFVTCMLLLCVVCLLLLLVCCIACCQSLSARCRLFVVGS